MGGCPPWRLYYFILPNGAPTHGRVGFGQCYARARALSPPLVLYPHPGSIDPYRSLSHLNAEAGRKYDLKMDQTHEKTATRGPRPKVGRYPGGPPGGPCGGGYRRSGPRLYVRRNYAKVQLQKRFSPPNPPSSGRIRPPRSLPPSLGPLRTCTWTSPALAGAKPHQWAPVGSTPVPPVGPIGPQPGSQPHRWARVGSCPVPNCTTGPSWAPARYPNAPLGPGGLQSGIQTHQWTRVGSSPVLKRTTRPGWALKTHHAGLDSPYSAQRGS